MVSLIFLIIRKFFFLFVLNIFFVVNEGFIVCFKFVVNKCRFIFEKINYLNIIFKVLILDFERKILIIVVIIGNKVKNVIIDILYNLIFFIYFYFLL